MDYAVNAISAIALAGVVFLGWLSQLVGLPGNWIIVVAAGIYAWLMPSDGRLALGWYTVIALVVLAVIGEILEFVAGALGVTKAGGTRRGAVLALAGSVIGGVVGLFVGVPIPVVGSLAAALIFGGVGALVGAFVGESSAGRDFDTSITIGKAAFMGRILGTIGKLIVGSVMVVLTLVALVV